MRLFLIWLQLFTGDGKDNIYSKLICKLHFRFKVGNLNCHSVLTDGNHEAGRALPRGSGLRASSRGSGLPHPQGPAVVQVNCGLSVWKANPSPELFVADKGSADSKRVTYSFI